MRALVYTAPHTGTLEERPRPQAASGECEIAIAAAGICGSDVSGFLGHSRRRRPPLVLGHELVGRLDDGQRGVVNPLISCGDCSRCLEGRRNLCSRWSLLGMDTRQGAFAEFVSVPRQQLFFVTE